MLKIGLTGGIGCGKTTVANCFADLGVPLIDADEIAHDIVEPGKPALGLLEAHFGKQIIVSGSLDRAALREIVFSDPEQKKHLESILHPLVYQEIQRQLDKLLGSYVIISIPLLLETKMQSFVDRILVIDCPFEQQINRVKNRDRLSVQRIQSIISTQVSREQRLSAADDIIDNSSSTPQQLAEQVKKLHNSYLLLSSVRL